MHPTHGIIFGTHLVSTLDAVDFSDAFLIFWSLTCSLVAFHWQIYCLSISLTLIFRFVMHINIYFIYPFRGKLKIFMTIAISRTVTLLWSTKKLFSVRMVIAILKRKLLKHAYLAILCTAMSRIFDQESKVAYLSS